MGKFKNFIFKTLVGGGLSLTLLCLLNSLNVYTADAVTTYTEGGVTYTYKAKDGDTNIKRLIITGSGTVTDCWEDKLKSKNGTKYSTVIQQIQFNSATLTAIDSDAFDDITTLKRVIISSYNNGNFNSTVFEDNTKITRLDLNDNITKVGNNAFKNCTNLATIELKNKVTNIGDYAFYKTKDTAVTLPSTLTRIGSYAFAESGIKSVTIPASVGIIDSYAFYNCDATDSVFTIENGIVDIGSYAFGSCADIKTLTIKNCYTINANAFSNSTIATLDIKNARTILENSFDNATISHLKLANVTSIASYALKDCSVARATINIIKVPDYCFYNNTSLTSLKLTCTTVGNSAFKGCTNLKFTRTTSTDANGNTVTTRHDMANVVTIEDYAFYDIAETTLVLPNTLKSIGNYAFYSVPITKVTIPVNVETIGDHTFSNCSNLATVTFKNWNSVAKSKLTNIGDNCFANCALTSFVVPINLLNLGDDAFVGNTSLTKVAIAAKSAESFGNNFGAYIEVTTDGLMNTYNIEKDLSNNCIKDIIIYKTVTSIPDFAFTNNTRLEFIRANSSHTAATPSTAAQIRSARSNLSTSNSFVTSIGDFAFAGCNNLKVCYFPTRVCEFGIDTYNIHGSLEDGRQIGVNTAGVNVGVSHSVTAAEDYENSGVARIDVSTTFEGSSTTELSDPQDYIFILDLTGSMNGSVTYIAEDGTKTTGTKMIVSGKAFECLLDTLKDVSPESRVMVIGYHSNHGYCLADWENYTDDEFKQAYGVADLMKKNRYMEWRTKDDENKTKYFYTGGYDTWYKSNGGTWENWCANGRGTDYRAGILGALNYVVANGWDYNKTNVLFMSDGGHNSGSNLASVQAMGNNLAAIAKNIYSVGVCVERDTVDTTIDYSNYSIIYEDYDPEDIEEGEPTKYIVGVKLSDNSELSVDEFPDCYVVTLDNYKNVTSIEYVEVDLNSAYKTSKWLIAVSPYTKYYNVANNDNVYKDFKNIFKRFVASSTSYISGLTLYDLFNEDVWEFVENLTPSNVVYNEEEGCLSSIQTGSVYDEATDSFIANEGNGSFYFYVRLKDAYRTSNATYLVTDNAKGEAVVGINGKLANIVVEDTTPYYLDWAIHYNLLYNKGLTNN